MASTVTSIQFGATRCKLQALRQRLAAALPPPAAGRRRRLHSLAARSQQQQGGTDAAAAAQAADTAASQPCCSSSSSGPVGELPASAQPGATKHMQLSDALYSYLLQHTREPQVLADLRAATVAQFPAAARMAISPDQGAFMTWLIQTLGARRIIEVGVFTGYSSIAMALALPPGGRLLACDRDPKAMALAREYWHKAGVADKIDERLGPAAATLDSLLADPQQHGAYDFAFIDADKKGYRAYYEQLLQLVQPGGVIAIDNVLWYGRVADPASNDGATQALRELNEFLLKDERVTFSLVPIGDGMAMCTRR